MQGWRATTRDGVTIKRLIANKKAILKGPKDKRCLLTLDLLKVVLATFLLVSFKMLKQNTCETRKNVSYFISKAFFVLEKIKF